MAKSKSKRKGQLLPLMGRSMCRSLSCDFECDDPGCEVCPQCGTYCRAIFVPPWFPQDDLAELFAAWRGGEIAPWPELLVAQAAQAAAQGVLQ